MCELIKLQSWLPKISFYSQKKKISQFYYNDVNLQMFFFLIEQKRGIIFKIYSVLHFPLVRTKFEYLTQKMDRPRPKTMNL